MLVILMLSILVGILDGFGLAMFLPLLQMVASDGGVASEQMGNLSFLVDGIEALGLSLNLTVVLLTMLLFFSLKGVFIFIEKYKNAIYQQYFIRNIREENILALAKYDYKKFVDEDAGRIQNTMSGEVSRVAMGFNHYMRVIQNSVLILVYTTLAFLANPQFALLIMIGGVLTNLLFNSLYKKTKTLSFRLTKENHTFQGLIIQQVAQFKYLKATGLIRDYAKKLISVVKQVENSQRKIGVLNAIMMGVREPLLIAVVVSVILVQVNLLGGSLALIILSILFFYRALKSVMHMQNTWNGFLAVTGSIENLKLFTNDLKKGKETTGTEIFSEFKDRINVVELSFSYGESPVLNNINLEITKNETLAIVGESGSGKTTLMNLLSGLIKPSNGRIEVDGKNLQNFNISTYQRKVGYITQEPVIFSDTIFNNVTFWEPKTSENRLRFRQALNQANIFEFVNTLPEAENTLLGNNGINLSGGQKQRISIARELYKNVEFLFMDEATSSLDSETEKNIQKSIEKLKGMYTIIVIAHRLSTIRNADNVVVLRNGEIVESGNYVELIGHSDAFKRMVELQEI